jgi:hypothetical protein
VSAEEDGLSQVVRGFREQRCRRNTDVSLIETPDLLSEMGSADQVDAAWVGYNEALPFDRLRLVRQSPACPMCLADGGATWFELTADPYGCPSGDPLSGSPAEASD